MTKTPTRKAEDQPPRTPPAKARKNGRSNGSALASPTRQDAPEPGSPLTSDEMSLPHEDPAATPSELMPRTAIRHIQRISARVRDLGARTAALHGLHTTDMYVLTVLLRSTPGFSLMATDLKSMLLYTSGGMTKRLDRLEEQRLVERLPHPSDRRAWLIRLTPKGKALAESVADHGRRNGVTMSLANVFDDAQWATLVDLLARLDTVLGASPTDPARPSSGR